MNTEKILRPALVLFAVLTLGGILVLLVPLLVKTWREQKKGL